MQTEKLNGASVTALAIDIGTTNTKLLLMDTVSAEIYRQESFRTPKIFGEGTVDFDGAALLAGIKETILSITATGSWNIERILITSVGEMGVIIDAQGTSQGPMIAWHDSRGIDYIKNLSKASADLIQDISGLPPHSNYSLAKIKWLEQHYKQSWPSEMTWLTLPDYIAFTFTGIRQTVSTMASRTMAFDIRCGKWSEELLQLYQLPASLFPPIARNEELSRLIMPAVADELHLSRSTLITVVGHDHMAGSLAVGLRENELLNSTGTTEGFLRIFAAYPMGELEKKAKLAGGRYVFPEKFTLYGSLPAAGLSHEWVRKLFDLSQDKANKIYTDLLNNYLKGNFSGDSDDIFIPHLAGSGSPDKSVKARALLYGMTVHTTMQDILYAVTQGVALELRQLFDIFADDDNIQTVKVIGPAIKNPLWLQLKADTLNRPIIVTEIEEAVSYGALIYAYPNLADHIPLVTRTVNPLPRQAARLNELYAKYKNFYNQKITLETQQEKKL